MTAGMEIEDTLLCTRARRTRVSAPHVFMFLAAFRGEGLVVGR